jgi:hypothetical protein
MTDPSSASVPQVFAPSAAPSVKLAPQPPTPIEQNISNDQQQLQKVRWEKTHGWGTDPTYDASGTMTDPGNHPGKLGKLAHVFSTLGNIAGDIFAPTVMANIPGTQMNRDLQEHGLAKRLNSEISQQSQEAYQGAETGKTQEETAEMPGKAASEEGLQGAETGHTEAETAAMQNPQYEVHDTAAGPLFVNKKTGAAQHLSVDGLPVGPKIQTKTIPLQIGGKPHQVLINDETGEPIRDLGESGEKPPVTNVNAGTWSVQTDTSGNPILLNSKTGETKPAPPNLARKPNAEEQKRADLAQNVNENLNTLEDIVNRRPDLFGPVAGRMTKGKQAIGTDDPDVATLKTVEDNLGMAMQSAHGMRSASHVETSAQSVLNGFNNEPKALLASIKAARDSVGTFQQNVEHTNEAGKPQSGGSGNSTPIVQQSPSTGKFRYSTDGGKTWQAGQPKQ